MLQWKARFIALLTISTLIAAAAGFAGLDRFDFGVLHIGW